MVSAKFPSKTHALASVTLSAALCCSLAACGPSGGPGGGNAPNAPAGNPSNSGTGSSPSASIDACGLISADDITALLGTTVEGKSSSNLPEAPGCTWENPENYESVTLGIGSPGTAPNNTLPPPAIEGVGTPGPDGMRYLGGGQVEFAAGNRSNTVQVAVVRISADERNAASVDLAKKVSPKIPN